MKISRDRVISLLQVFFGSVIMALSMNIFLIPYKIAPGGVSGIATVVYHVSGEKIPVGIAMLAMNIPLFLAGMKIKGRSFIIKSTLGAIFLSVIIDLTEPWISGLREIITAASDYSQTDILLFALAGGFTTGLGLGFVFKEDATTGGTDMAAALLNRIFPWVPVGTLLIILDGLVILLATVVFRSFRLGLYSAVTLYIGKNTGQIS